MKLHTLEQIQLKEESRIKRRLKKLNPKMIVTGKGMKRFARPAKTK